MALAFPPTPSLGDVYQRWTYDGRHWVPTADPQAPFVSKAGDTMLGQLVLDDDASLPLEATPLRQVEDMIATGSLYQGTWEADTNVPDLSDPAVQKNGFTWVVTTPDPNIPVTVPATPTLPGLNGLSISSGSHITWSDAASEFQIVPGASGMPPGGATYEALIKQSANNFDADWQEEGWRPGTSNFAIGTDALSANTTGGNNSAYGAEALMTNQSGSRNTALGKLALSLTQTGSDNTGVGYVALGSLGAAASTNTALGSYAGYYYGTSSAVLTGATDSVYVGQTARASANNPTNEIVIGAHALGHGSNSFTIANRAYVTANNTALGNNALLVNAAGVQNVALGMNALAAATASQNAAVGAGALSGLTSGGNNTAVGANAGQSVGGGVVPNLTGSLSVFLGHDARPLNDGDSNEIVIGNAARGNGSNTITLGNSAVTDLYTSAYQRFPQGLLSRDPTGSYEIATRNYVDQKTIAPGAGPFPYIFSLPAPSQVAPGQWGYALTIPGWTTASRDVFIIRGAQWMSLSYLRLSVNGTTPRPIRLVNPFQPYGSSGASFFQNVWPISSLGRPQQGPGSVNTGQGTYHQQLAGPEGNFDYMPGGLGVQAADIMMLRFDGLRFVQVYDSQLQVHLARVSGAARGPGSYAGLSRSLTAGSPTVTDVPMPPWQNMNRLYVSGGPGIAQMKFRTEDVSVLSIHNRHAGRFIRRLVGYNNALQTNTLRIVPSSDSWTQTMPSGSWTFTSTYRLMAAQRLYGAGTVTSAVGAGYIDIALPAQCHFEIQFKTTQDDGNGLWNYNTGASVFSGAGFPQARTVVWIEDILVYRQA